MGRHKTEIGDALLLPVETAIGDAGSSDGVHWDYWISAPTMVTPMVLKNSSRNAYLAFRAVLRCILAHNSSTSCRGSCHQNQQTTCNTQGPITVTTAVAKEILSVAVPGLGTGIGMMDPTESARQMRDAYDEVMFPGKKDVATQKRAAGSSLAAKRGERRQIDKKIK